MILVKLLREKKVEHVFEFENVGNEPLILSDVRTTCGCTAPEWPREPIAPRNQVKDQSGIQQCRKNGNAKQSDHCYVKCGEQP